MKKDLVDFLLSDFRKRPGMFLGSYSLSRLPTLIAGFMVACNYYDESKTGMNRFSDFHDWFDKRHSLERSSSWTLPFLEMTNYNEKDSLDLFFRELELFSNESPACWD
jgi:hypothetical protein